MFNQVTPIEDGPLGKGIVGSPATRHRPIKDGPQEGLVLRQSIQRTGDRGCRTPSRTQTRRSKTRT